MRGVTVASPGAEYKVVDDISKPSPGNGQVLVKSIFSGVNPVYVFHLDPVSYRCDWARY
jgi:NADPH:quinone reductase-like Zn-dependent oxidoreductase